MPATGSCCCCWPFKKAASGKETPCYWRATATAAAAVPTKTRPSRTGKHHGPEGRTESKICVSRGRNVPSEISYKKLAIRFSRLAAGSLLAASLLPLSLLLRLLVSAAAYWCLLLPAAACCCLRLPAACCCLLLPAAACCWCCCWWLLLLWCCCCAAAIKQLPKQETATAAAAVPTKTRPSWTGKHHGPEGRMESEIDVSGPERPFWNLLEKACYTFLDAGYWLLLLLLLVQLTLQKGGFRQGNPMLLKGDSDCCCCCAHKDTALPDGETPWPWRRNWRTESKICVSGGRNVPSEISYKKLAIRFWLLARCWLLHCCRCAYCCVCLCLLLPTDACCCLLLPAAACGCLLPAAACCSLLLPAAGAAAGGCCCCCCAAAIKQHGCCCCSSPKQESKVLFPGALPLASAGVGGYI